MGLYLSSSEEGPSHQNEEESSHVSMKTDRSLEYPPLSSNEEESSRVSMKSDQSLKYPPPSSSNEEESSHVSIKSDQSLKYPPLSSNEEEPSHVSMKSDQSLKYPPSSSNEEESSHVSMKSDRSLEYPPLSSNEEESSHLSMKSDQSLKYPPLSSNEEESCHVSMKGNRSLEYPPLSSNEGEPSHVSMKSNRSLEYPPLFSNRKEPSHVSMKSDRSLEYPPLFSNRKELSHVSMKSNRSLEYPPLFSNEEESSHVSMKSDRSLEYPPLFSNEGEPSHVSMKSDRSLEYPPLFSNRKEPSHVSMKSDRSLEYPPLFSNRKEPSHVSMKSDRSLEYPPLFSNGGESCHVSMKSDRSLEYPPLFSNGGEPSHVSMKNDWYMRPATFKIKPFDSWQCCTGTTMNINSMMKRTEDLLSVFKRHKTSMKIKYEGLFEGNKAHENKTMLNQIYTELYIIEGEHDMVNEEHEVLQMQKLPRGHMHDTQIINCLDIFKAVQVVKGETKENIGLTTPGLRHDEKKEDKGIKLLKLKTALTKGIAGIGKTVSVQKFVLDWAEGKANQDVDFIFVLSFRELNLIKDDQYSLHKLLCAFHPELKDVDPKIYDVFKSVFILDGLDESRIPLNFSQCEKVSDITMTSSVGGLMTNLIKGELLPSALLWITSRPAAANQIPPKYINRVTEIRGFSNPQKEEYFIKRISDQDQAQKIISHIKTARSLHIMCHIPVFCWISSTVFQRIMEQDSDTEIPTTLTEMYSHFLLTQMNTKNAKYERNLEKDPKKLLESNRTMLLKLAELAFNQLMKGNVMFYEEDLRESGIDLTEASVYSGFVTEILKEECGLYQKKIYCFIHLSFQEFLAAVYVFHCYQIKNMEVLYAFEPQNRKWFDDVSLEEVLEGSVDKAVKSPNGHLDLFLRFLLGISLESNQRILQGLLTLTDSSSEETLEYIKKLIKNEGNQYSTSTERSISLFLCLSEMNDQSLSREIQEYLKSETHWLSPGQCSTIACMLLISNEVLEELDLKQYNTSQQGYQRLIPAMTVCRKALLAGCNLTRDFGETLCSLLQSTNSSLKELDLSNNDLQDSGVELLFAGLKSSHCKLQILRLAGCKLTTKSSETIRCVLQSANSSLKELDLSNNDLQNLGVKQLAAALTSHHCNLETLRLALCKLEEKACEYLGSALQSVNSPLKDLELSNNDLQDSGVELLCAGLKSSHCKLQKLRLSGCMVTYEGCSSLASALISNSSYLRELDLTYNHPGESGVKLLSDLLEDPHCKLEKLQMEHGGMARIKSGLQKYACVLTLDINTAHAGLSLSKENRMVEGVEEGLPYPDHPDRFENWQQVLSVESLTGRCYWEVEWSEVVTIAVAYKQMNRKEKSIESGFGLNKQSWSLYCYNSGYLFRVNNKETAVPVPSSPSSRVGVYLDWPAGILSFFSVSPQTPTLTHLCTIHSQFTEPLHAGFGALPGSSLWVCTESF